MPTHKEQKAAGEREKEKKFISIYLRSVNVTFCLHSCLLRELAKEKCHMHDRILHMQIENHKSLVFSSSCQVNSVIFIALNFFFRYFNNVDKFLYQKSRIFNIISSFLFYRDQLFSNQLYLSIDSSAMLTEATSNGSLTISIVTYKNLTYFLPKMYFSRNR